MKTELKNQIKEQLEFYMSEHNMSQNKVAKKSEVNVSFISAIRKGESTVNAGKQHVEIADKWYEMLANFVGFKLVKTYWETVETPQMLRTLATLQDAKDFAYTNVLIGETGCGKTYIAELFSRKHPIDLFLITVGQSDNIGDLFDKVLEKIKIPSAKTKSKKMRDIVAHLKALKLEGHKPMLIFDEAEYMKQPALCAMKELYDNLNGICSIVMIGTDQLIKNIERLKKRNKDGIPQLYRRIKFGIRTLPLIDKSFKQFLNGISDSGLVQFLRKNCDNYGELHDCLVPAMREADRTGEPLTENFVRTVLNIPNY